VRGDTSDLVACEQILKEGSKSFHFASRLLPARLRGPTAAMYSFCRITDSIVDADGASTRDLESLVARLDGIYAGEPADEPVDRAFSKVVSRYGIPRAIPDALLEGFEWDLGARDYGDLPELYEYCVRVGSTVGLMMSLLMDVRSADTLARAADLGVAMQLTNIARDVGEDAGRGRFYLPRDWIGGSDDEIEAWLRSPVPSDSMREGVRRLLACADAVYARAGSGIEWLPADCRLAIRSALLMYENIGTEIRRAGYDSVTRRAYTSLPRKLTLLYRAARPSRSSTRLPDQSVHGKHEGPYPGPEYERLVEAAAGSMSERAAVARS
jgi:phytoene synthase